jgi:hypothetical protein
MIARVPVGCKPVLAGVASMQPNPTTSRNKPTTPAPDGYVTRRAVAAVAAASERIEAYVIYVIDVTRARHGDVPLREGPPGRDLKGVDRDARVQNRRRASTLFSDPSTALRVALSIVEGRGAVGLVRADDQ